MMMNQEKTSAYSTVLILLLFFISGALALIYQVVWARLMMQVFGSTALAVGTVLAAFMCGMAIGAWTIGKYADRSRNCLRLYAGLEIGIAVAALLSHLLLVRTGPIHLAVYQLLGSSVTAFAIIRFLLAFLLVMLPTILMGATLPVLARFMVNRESGVGIKLSTLYSVNTFGAVTGGVEYTLSSVLGTGADIGLLAEYSYDGRSNDAVTPYDNDVFAAVRLALNDVQDTQLIAGTMTDVRTGTTFLNIEGSRRLGADWKLAVEGRAFLADNVDDPLFLLRRESYLGLDLRRYF